MRKVSTIGDVNPIEHGGGFIFKAPGQSPWVEYTYGLTDSDDEEKPDTKVEVYRVDIETCGERLLSDLRWADLGAVERSCGYDASDNPYGKLRTIRQRAMLVEDVAGFYGWHELDQYPLTLTIAELRKRWSL